MAWIWGFIVTGGVLPLVTVGWVAAACHTCFLKATLRTNCFVVVGLQTEVMQTTLLLVDAATSERIEIKDVEADIIADKTMQ